MAKPSSKIGRTFLIYGQTGTGKTEALKSLLRTGLRGFVHDADGQAAARLSAYVKKGQVTIDRLRNYEQAVVFFGQALNGKIKGYDFYALDTLSIFNEEAVRPDSDRKLQAKTAAQVKGMIPTWDDRRPAAEMLFNILRWGTELADPDSPNPMHVVFTAHEAIVEDKEKKTFIYGPALPGRFAARGPALVQECYHTVVTQEEGKEGAELKYWFCCKNDGTWPAKGSDCLDFFEPADLGAVLKKIEQNA